MADKYSLPPNHPSPNEPKNIGEIVLNAMMLAKENVSWLGRWEDVGWAIRIGRKLTDEEWRVYGGRAEEAWDSSRLRYDPEKSLALLKDLWPELAVELVYPRCNKRVKTDGKSSGGLPVHILCDAYGTNATSLEEAGGTRVCVVRCDDHAGQL